ncbi:unnamed protein product, partial [Sphacelaria rigidula]
RYGVDSGSTFAPVCRLRSQRLLLAIVTAKSWPILALDVQTVFLDGKLQKTSFCTQAPGFETLDDTFYDSPPPQKRALCGLRNKSPNVWNSTIDTGSQNVVFFVTASDPCVYVRGSHGGYMNVDIVRRWYTDDRTVHQPAAASARRAEDKIPHI